MIRWILLALWPTRITKNWHIFLGWWSYS